MECVLNLPKYNYFERIECHGYYRAGKLMKLDQSMELIMLGLSELGMAAVTDVSFEIGDVLLYDIRLNSIPYDKLMGEIKCIQLQGDMYRLDIQFLGMPNTLFERIKEMLHTQEGNND